MKPFRSSLPFLSACVLTPMVPQWALADSVDESTLDEIVVSADFRPTLASETAVSLTDIDAATMDARGAEHLEDVLGLAPNVNLSAGASRGQFFQIRGMGSRSQFNAPINPSVGLIIDGVDFSRTGGAATLFDMESVEVLRGPQGTRFGSNGLAGTINLQSKAPTDQVEAHAQLGLADYNTRDLGVAVGGALVEDKLLGRLSVFSHQSDGYMKNDYLNRRNTQEQDETTLRGKLSWLASDDLTIDLSYLYLNIDNGYDAFTLDNSRTSVSDDPGQDQQHTHALSIKSQWEADERFLVETEWTYLNSDIIYSYDADWGYAGQFDDALYPYVGTQRFDRARDNASAEIRLVSNPEGRIFNKSTDWVVGIYRINQDESFKETSDYGVFGTPPVLSGDYLTQNSSVYGQLDTHLTDKLTLVTGARVEYFKAKYDDNTALSIHTGEVLFGGKLGLNYQVTPEHLLFTSLSRGYKAGGVNNTAALPTDQRDFETEYNLTLELGAKSRWLDDRLTTDLTLFYTQRRDAQVNEYVQIGPQFISYTDNAAKATHQGIEASLDWLVSYDVRLMASVGLLDAEFDRYAPNGESMKGRDVAHAPNYTYSLGSEVYLTDAWTLRANVEGKDAFYFSDNHDARSKSYATVNASAQYVQGEWSVTLWARNLFDKDYYTRGFYFGNNPANGYQDERYVQYGEPRMVGLTLAYDY
jgi:iron complex outermembrane receptor protein